LPPTGPDGVNFSDGFFTDASNIPSILPDQPPTSQSLVKLYAAKHNPFAYFRSIQEGETAGASLKNVVGFMGAGGLYEDLRPGRSRRILSSRRISAMTSMVAEMPAHSAISTPSTTERKRA
jgi:hypothetical protein